MASALGALFVVGGIAVAAYLVPQVWVKAVTPVVAPIAPFVDVALRLVAQGAAVAAIVWAGTLLAGSNPPRGIRGGIFLIVSAVIATFFIARTIGLQIEEVSAGAAITVAVAGGLLGLTYRGLTSTSGERWMQTIEEQGWLSTFSYKRTQGLRVRRLTMLGLLLIGWSGVYTIIAHESLGGGDWKISIPFTGAPRAAITVLSDINYSVPVLLAVLTFWVSWRAVNIPAFADFLIATEAEMNKVSWSSRKRLLQDTVVVLVTVVILTAFLLLVDLFWGWLLSQKFIHVLPPRTTPTGQIDTPLGPKNW
ncbi:Preprotein translocase subunit SecE [Fimbriiglobus ruber]|uniref:Protein translocase subunit SecE n=1 Tax=Fimbriiglobus ruber TaxID=1908690 RepID=A0A225D4R4_9BACT|nr:Preprotein translocase subunit SecE [Fimbriiglobus ruber]